MKKVKVKANAKVNLTLDVVGVKDGYHMLNSLMASISLADIVIVKKRKDKNVTLKMVGFTGECPLEKNTAYKSAVLYMQTFDTLGVDITIKKGIVVGGGLGGSSADIAGVLRAMNKLFNRKDNLHPLADKLGSDSGYLLDGGYKKIQGRGEKIVDTKIAKKLYLIILPDTASVSSAESYKEYDRLNITYPEITDRAITLLEQGNVSEFNKVIKNDLYEGSAMLNPNVKKNVEILSRYNSAVMTGSGCCVFSAFETKKERDRIYKFLKKQNLPVIKTHTTFGN